MDLQSPASMLPPVDEELVPVVVVVPVAVVEVLPVPVALAEVPSGGTLTSPPQPDRSEIVHAVPAPTASRSMRRKRACAVEVVMASRLSELGAAGEV